MSESNQNRKEKPKLRTADEVYAAYLQLGADEREKLHSLLLADTENRQLHTEAELAVVEECKRRDALVRQGKMELVDADRVMRKARGVLNGSAG